MQFDAILDTLTAWRGQEAFVRVDVADVTLMSARAVLGPMSIEPASADDEHGVAVVPLIPLGSDDIDDGVRLDRRLVRGASVEIDDDVSVEGQLYRGARLRIALASDVVIEILVDIASMPDPLNGIKGGDA
jgi:hypothetical protein